MIDINRKVDEIFDYKTKQSQLNEVCDYIKNTFVKPKYTSIPKEYYPFLHKLMTYRKYDSRGKYEYDDIKTFFVGKDAYKHNSIMFYDKNGHCDFIGCSKAIGEWQKEKNANWEHMKGAVLQVLRNIAAYKIRKYKDSLTFPMKSDISEQIIESIKDCHIDHYDMEFSELAFNWMMLIKENIEQKNHKFIDIIYVLYELIDDNRELFKDPKWNRAFYDYHNSHTHLRAITKTENLKREKYFPDWSLLKENGYYKKKFN